ncbi:hypothetical protein [Nitritalea halalkaliphila]|nr:hypothetical protein [Nitritalea halalkaliphila]
MDFQVEDFVLQFTLTPALAAELMPYVCGRHPSMTGNVIAVEAE